MNQTPRQADFVLGTCPHCLKVVRVPMTAVTAQSTSQVRCPICNLSYEVADILEQAIPSVQVVPDTVPTTTTVPRPNPERPERINAIDTPELFHIGKGEHRPNTEKKNGRFIVPDLLSRGIKKKGRKFRRRHRNPSDPKLAESLARLKENTVLPPSAVSASEASGSEPQPRSGKSRNSRRHRSQSGHTPDVRRERHGSRKHANAAVSASAMASAAMTKMRPVDLKAWIKSWKANLQAVVSWDKFQSRSDRILIGIGALMAIPMLHLVMWWFIGIDPLGLSRPTNYFFPFIVPNELKRPVEVRSESPNIISDESEKSGSVEESRFRMPIEGGKLPTPKIDPASVRPKS